MTYIVFEGIDGCGKDTQADLMVDKLRVKGRSVLRLNEPDDTLETGKLLRQCLRDGTYMSSHLFLFLADRIALWDQKIKPALDRGMDVVCSRSLLSSLVYQQDFWGLDYLHTIHEPFQNRINHVVILDLEPSEGLKRSQNRQGHAEVYETLNHLTRFRKRYAEGVQLMEPYIKQGEGEIHLIDANRNIKDVHRQTCLELDL